MNTGVNQPNELFSLLEGYLAATLDTTQQDRLVALLRTDRAARLLYLQYMDLNASLCYATARTVGMELHVDLRKQEAFKSLVEPSASNKQTRLASMLPRFARMMPGGEYVVGGLVISAVAAAFWGLATVGMLLFRNGATINSPGSENDSPIVASDSHEVIQNQTRVPKDNGPFIARLTSLTGHWADSSATFMPGDPLPAKALRLQWGTAELEYKTGTRVLISGPCEFELQSEKMSYLKRGHLEACVPSNVIGFTVATPTAEVVDLGTEFGVEVAPSGKTEIEVFVGAVDVHPSPKRSLENKPAVERLVTGQALRVDLSSKKKGAVVVQRVDPIPDRFAKSLQLKRLLLGGTCIARAHRDTVPGVVGLMRAPTRESGRAVGFHFNSQHDQFSQQERWLTPIILAFDQSTGTYTVTGIGRSFASRQNGLQIIPFQLVVGSDKLLATVHVFGFFNGTVDASGHAIKTTFGSIDFDQEVDNRGVRSPAAPNGEQSKQDMTWLFTPKSVTPVMLELGLEFRVNPKPGQIELFSDPNTPPDERVYSAQLAIIPGMEADIDSLLPSSSPGNANSHQP